MTCFSPLKGFRNRDTGGITFRRDNTDGPKMEVPCGQCLGCALDYRRMWAMRVAHEAALWEYYGGNSFITLTYRDEADCTEEQWRNGLHVPSDWSLHKSHMTKFLKRLRKWVFSKNGLGREEEYDEEGALLNGIRHFYAGEYGKKCKHGIDVDLIGCPVCNVGRPHFHAAIFNLHFEDLEAYQSDNGVMRYTSPTLERLWGYGFVDVGDLNYSSAAYIAGYVTKKVRGVRADDWYRAEDMDGEEVWLTPEFLSMSRGNAAYKGKRCGLGAGWFEQYGGDIFPADDVPVPGKGVVNGVPRYYDEILKEENPEMYEEVKERRKNALARNRDEYTDDRLLAKFKCRLAESKLKPRIL